MTTIPNTWVDGWCANQVWPICGDGLTLQITHTKTGRGVPETLMSREIVPDPRDKPQRQKVSPVYNSFKHPVQLADDASRVFRANGVQQGHLESVAHIMLHSAPVVIDTDKNLGIKMCNQGFCSTMP